MLIYIARFYETVTPVHSLMSLKMPGRDAFLRTEIVIDQSLGGALFPDTL